MYGCEYCDTRFDSYYSLRSHINGSVREGVPGCLQRSRASEPDYDDDSTATNTITTATPVDLQQQICRRHQDDSILSAPRPLNDLGIFCSARYSGSVDYGVLVNALQEYCKWLLQSRSQKFWKLFLATRHLPQDDQKNLLQMIRKLFNVASDKDWCADKRAVRYFARSQTILAFGHVHVHLRPDCISSTGPWPCHFHFFGPDIHMDSASKKGVSRA